MTPQSGTTPPGKFRAALFIAAALAAVFMTSGLAGTAPVGTAPVGAAPTGAASAGIDARRAHEERRSGVWLSVRGEIVRTLKDDLKGDRHQRFIIRLKDGQTLLINHNIDLAPRVPLALGDELEVRGRYEWNARGGLLHWTHRDPAGGRPGGWIRLGGRTYR